MDLSTLSQNILKRFHSFAGLTGAPVITPLIYSDRLSERVGADVYLKCEQFQRTGSFKFRGAFSKINTLPEDEKARGVVAASTGNHGMAVAKAAALSQVEATIFVPESASDLKKEKIGALGASILTVDGDCLVAESTARAHAERHECTFISPYNDWDVLEGQGGIGVELYSQLSSIDSVLIAVGGGGLFGGVGAFLKGHAPTKHVEMIGCWPENSPIMNECLKQGKVTTVAEQPTLSDATAGNIELETITFEVCQQVMGSQFLVSEQEIAGAMRWCLEHEGMMIEGAAGVTIAALLKHKAYFLGKTVVLVLCGRNIIYDQFKAVVL